MTIRKRWASRITHGCQVKGCIIILELYALPHSNNMSNRSYGQGNHNHGQSSNDRDPAVIIVGERKEWWLSLGHVCWSDKCCTWSVRMLVGPALRACTGQRRSYEKLRAGSIAFWESICRSLLFTSLKLKGHDCRFALTLGPFLSAEGTCCSAA